MVDTSALVNDAADVDGLSTAVLAFKLLFIGHLLLGGKRILAYLSACQLFLIACNLLLVLSSATHI